MGWGWGARLRPLEGTGVEEVGLKAERETTSYLGYAGFKEFSIRTKNEGSTAAPGRT